jgi:hypothetical protein
VKIRNIFNQRLVCRMPDTDDDWNVGCKNGTNDALVIERGQVISSATAASQNDHVNPGLGQDGLKRLDDTLRGAFTLHLGWCQKQLRKRKSAANDFHDVVPGGTVLGRDDTNSPRCSWQRTLAKRIEESFGFETLSQILEFQRCKAQSRWLHQVCNELHCTGARIDRESAMDDDLISEPWHLMQPQRFPAEQDALQAPFVVAQDEVRMACRRPTEVNNFPLQPEISV